MRYKQLFLLLLLILWFGFTPTAQAEMCRDRFGQKVCILKLKRSAKNYWEYRAKVSVDGEKQRYKEVYNCRDLTLTRRGKYSIPFKPNGPGELVCQTFQKRANTYRSGRW